MDTKPVLGIEQDQFFKSPPIPSKISEMTTISYQKEKKEVEKLKKALGNKFMSNKEIGERTFEYYKKMECPDEE